MSQRLVTSFINTNVPGAYPNIVVQSQPVGLGSSGNVVIIGEAVGGPDYTNDDLPLNFFTPNQLAQVAQKYISGPIVDAFTAFAAPSADAGIIGTANQIWIVKTNVGTQASAVIPSYGSLVDQNFGIPGNQYNFSITSLQAEVPPQVQGGTIPAFGAALNAASFTIRLNGGAADVITLSSTPSDHANVATLVIELNAMLPAGIVASAGTASNSIALTMSFDATQYTRGNGRDFELFDSTPGDLAALGLSAQLYVASAQSEVEVQVNRASTNLSETFNIATQFAMSVGYQGTTATLTIDQATSMLTTTVTGGSGGNLSVNLAQYTTMADVAAFINAQPGYAATVNPAAQQLPPSVMDDQSAIGIASSGASLEPGLIKDSLYTFEQALATSKAVNFVPTATAGLPNPQALTYLAGGTQGGTSAAEVFDAIQALGQLSINMVVPLFSRDASQDIIDDLTDSSSTYTIAAINAAVKSHVIQYSTPDLKRNRIAFLSYWNDSEAGNYDAAKAVAQGLANFRCSLTIQKATQVDSVGVQTIFLPWYTACIAAGMQAGGFYKSITNKLANIISFTDPAGFNSGDPGDDEDALNAGLLFLTQIAAGPIWVSDQTTYGVDANFVYNSIQAVYDSDILALDLAASAQASFVGQSLADIDAATVLSFLSQKMDGYRRLKLIAPSTDAPLGYKNPNVEINAPTLSISVEIKLATAIYFVPITINVSNVQQTA